jgi:gliding motility-associated-like protein
LIRKLRLFPLLLLAAVYTGYAQVPVASILAIPTSGCAPLAVSFNGSATGTGPFTWSWNFGGVIPNVSKATSIFQNDAVQFNTPGTYTVTLTAKNASGTSAPVTVQITVNPVPVADFTQDKTTGCYPTWVNFTNLSTAGPGATITSYLWNFGDGTQDTIPSPSHRYTTGGSHNVILYVKNNFGCQGNAQVKNVQKAIVLTGGIFPNFNIGIASSCNLPVTANFTNTTTGVAPRTYNWDFGDGGGFIDNTLSPTHNYSTAGSYTVRLAASSTQGCSDTLNLPLNISANGNLTDFTFTDTVCINTVVNFTNISSPNPNSSSWDYGDGSPVDVGIKNGQHTYTIPGKHTVLLTNTFAGCNGFISHDIYVVNPPVASFTGVNMISCKPPLTTTFTNTSTGASSWVWDFGDGTTSNLQNPPPHTYTVYFDYTVRLTALSASGCSTAAQQVVHVDKPTVGINGMPAYGCAPYTFTPTASVSAIDGVASYSWDFGNGNTSTSATPPAQTYPAGLFTVTLTITTTGGCTATASGTVKVGSVKPTAAFTFIPPAFCVDSLFKFTDGSLPVPPGTDQWFWDFGDGNTATIQNPTHAYILPGNYNVRLTAYDRGCWDSISHTVVVNPPLADFKFTGTCGQNNSFTFTDNSMGPITTWFWDFGDGFTSTLQNPPVHVFPVGPPKTYNVTLTVTNGGCANKKTYAVQANQATLLSFSSNPVCANTPITITATSPASIFSYQFVYGDGNTSLGTSPSVAYTYTKPGTYQVKVITTENITGCVDSSSVYAMVVNGPTAKFTPPPPLTCGALTYSFTDLSTVYPVGSSIVKWVWDFGDGVTSNVKNPPAHTYSFQGNFVPTLTVTDNNGCSSTLDTFSAITVSIPIASFTISDTFSCPNAPIPLRFNNMSTAFNPSYTWDFGDGTINTVSINPIYTYSIVDTFYPKLSIIDVYGCTASYTYPKPVIVDTPHASFTMSGNYSACPPFNVDFTFTGHYALTYAWDFTDGNGSPLKNPKNLFANPGDYWPYLIVISHGGCSAQSDSQNVHIDGPIGTFTYSPLAGCDSLDVTFNVTTTNVVSFTWNFSDGSPLVTTAVPTITHNYTKPGQYTPIVTLKDAAGCAIPKFGTNFINVDAITKINFNADRTILCDSGMVNFKDISSLGPNTIITNYIWDFGDGSPIVSGPADSLASHNYTTIGNYMASLSISTFGGCSASYSIPITIAASPKVAINGLLSQCEPAILNFAGVETVPDPNGPLTWIWDFGNGQSSTLQNPTPVSYPKAGEYVVSLTATNTKGCSMMTDTTKPSHLFIFPIPVVNAGADTTICDTSTLQLLASGQATTYNWLAPTPPATLTCLNCNNPIASSPSSTFFILNGTSPQGCSAKDTINVTVNTQVTVNASGTDSVCLGQSATLSATGAAIYNWTPAQGLNNPNIANPVATPDASQIGNAPSNVITYTVTGYDNKKCYSDTKSINITAFNYPVIGLTPNVTINVGSSYQISSTVTTNIVSLNWTPSNTLSCANCLTPLATPTKTTKYILTAVNDGGCATLDSIRVQVICDGTNFFVPNTFSPNGDGVNDNFVVNGVGLNVIPSITIYNRWGQIVFQKSNFAPNVPSQGWDGTFNGQPAPPDVYIYTIQILCNNATLIPYHGNVTLIR